MSVDSLGRYPVQAGALVLRQRQQVEGRAEHGARHRAAALLLHRAQEPQHAGEKRVFWHKPGPQTGTHAYQTEQQTNTAAIFIRQLAFV